MTAAVAYARGVKWNRAMVAMLGVVLCFAALPSLTTAVSAVSRAGVHWTRGVAGSGGGGVVDPGLRGAHGKVAVIVSGTVGSSEAVDAAVRANGGTVAKSLPIVDGVLATVPADRIDSIAQARGVMAVTKDYQVKFQGFTYGGTTTASSFVASADAGPAWTKGDQGQGVGVAVIDTGISPVDDLKGRIVQGPDLSGEGTYIDTFGHGTVMAGIIGGNGADSAGQNGGAYTGMAPKVTLVSVKTAGANGAVDVSTILQAMHWVSAYKDEFNIRVLNLSWGTPSTQDPRADPINYAVERLWRQGIVVVAAAGNAGPNAGTIIKPGDDPLVLTVGAYDDHQDGNPNNDQSVDWSSRGPTAQGLTKPDVVAPGRYIIATRSFGSTIEEQNPQALFAPSYIRGSGTSEATAVVSGAAALVVQAHPDYTPDQVKAVLMNTASPLNKLGPDDQGKGRIDVGAALTADPGPAVQQTATSSGLGSIEAARGGMNVQAFCPGSDTSQVIQGEIDVRCQPWDGAAWTGAAWTGASWTGASWTGAAWTGSDWMGGAWTGASWTGAAWTGASWTGGSWQGAAWTGASWTGAAWTGASWTGASWTGAAWTGASWTGASWTGGSWTGASWTGDSWMTAFWGGHPKWFQHVPGEVSDPPPGLGMSTA